MTTAISHSPPDQAAAASEPSISRGVLVFVTWLFAALVAAQVYLAGAFLMYDSGYFEAHRALGWSLTYAPIVLVVVAATARADRPFWISLAVLFVAVQVQPFIARIPADGPAAWLRPLHPVNAMLIAVLAFYEAAAAWRLWRHRSPSP